MSAAVAWDLAPTSTRPQLRLVPTGDAVVCRPAPRVRLTRRGRLSVSLSVLALVTWVAFLLAPGPSVQGLTIDHAVTVSAGQSLSEVADAQLPQLPVTDAMARIQQANNLSSDQVHAGQSLLIPRVG